MLLFSILGLKRELQDNYDWLLANCGNYSMSDILDRYTFDVLMTTPSNRTVCGAQGMALDLTYSHINLLYTSM